MLNYNEFCKKLNIFDLGSEESIRYFASYYHVEKQMLDSECKVLDGSKPSVKETEKDVNPMNYASVSVAAAPIASDESNQRKYLRSRLNEVFYTLKEGLRTKFNMDEPAGPKTIGDLIDRLKNGQYSIEDADNTSKKISYWRDYFSWRTTPADVDGYNKAKEALNAAKQIALDAIEIKSPDDGLAALNTFEAWTYSVS